MVTLFIQAFIVFSILLIIHFIICHLTSSKLFIFKSLAILLIAISIFAYYFLMIDFIYFIFFIISLISLWNAFIIFFINLQNSISFRILRDISDLNQKSVNYKQIDSFYPDEMSLNDRLLDMESNNFIEVVNSDIRITPKGTYFAKTINFFRKLFAINSFG